jgi:hypothetical protein
MRPALLERRSPPAAHTARAIAPPRRGHEVASSPRSRGSARRRAGQDFPPGLMSSNFCATADFSAACCRCARVRLLGVRG